MISMSNQNYCMVNDQTNSVDNVVIWDGSTDTWTPPDGYIMLIQSETLSKVWAWNDTDKSWELSTIIGQGSIGFLWDGTYLITNAEKPINAPMISAIGANQPIVSGSQTL